MYVHESVGNVNLYMFCAELFEKMLCITRYSYKVFTHLGWQRSSRYFFGSTSSSSALDMQNINPAYEFDARKEVGIGAIFAG